MALDKQETGNELSILNSSQPVSFGLHGIAANA